MTLSATGWVSYVTLHENEMSKLILSARGMGNLPISLAGRVTYYILFPLQAGSQLTHPRAGRVTWLTHAGRVTAYPSPIAGRVA